MTRRLVLVRHAKAVQGGRSDAERPLADRGVADAGAVGRWLADQGLMPDRVVVSPSTRTRQTWALAAPAGAPTPDIDDRIYENTVEDLLAVVRDTTAETGTLLLVGHNPSIEAFAATFDDGTGEGHHALAKGFPTSGVGVFTVDAAWADASTGTLIAFAVPRGHR